MQIYHGGYSAIENPEIIAGRYAKDFGNGFYCTELKEQAIRWAKRYETPIVSIYEYQPNASLNIILFNEMTEEWLDFVVKSRNGERHSYFKKPTHQICFCTENALQCITFLNSEQYGR